MVRALSLILITLGMSSAFAYNVDSKVIAEQNDYVDQERKAMSCVIAQERADAIEEGRIPLWDQVPYGTKGKKKKISSAIYAALSSANCDELYPEQVQIPQSRGESFIPVYSDIPQDISTLACGFNTLEDYKTCEFAREDYLRPYFLKRKKRCESVPDRKDILTDATYWHAYLLNNGYACTAQSFRATNMRNAQSLQLQIQIDKTLSEIEKYTNIKQPPVRKHPKTQRPIQQKIVGPLNGLTLVIIPPLAYERSYFRNAPYGWFGGSGGAKVSPSQMKKGLKDLGADKVYFIDRITSDPLSNQVAQTLPDLKRIDAKEKNGYVALTFSYGTAVMAKILRDHESELPNLKGVVNYGGTPHGSVIGEYKSRMDYFIKRQSIPNAKKAIGQAQWIDFLDDIDPFLSNTIDDSIVNAMKRENLLELSYKNPALHDPAREAAVEVPVVNYVLLNPTEEQRANDLRDPVYQNMLAYGPTEGSSRLVDVSFRSKNSYTVFMDDMGHLAFLYLDKKETTKYILAPLLSAVQLGAFD